MKKKRIWIILLVAVIVLGGGGLAYWKLRPAAEVAASTESEIKTSKARVGEILLTATGAGTVISAVEVDLGFETNGTVDQVNIRVGDEVATGAILASIDEVDAQASLVSAQLQVEQAEQSMISAEVDYEQLLEDPTEAERLEAQAAVQSAQQKLDDLTEEATEAEIASAKANLADAQEAYDDLVNGPSDIDLQRAQNAVAKAKNSLYSSQMSRDAKGGDRDVASGAYASAEVAVWNAEISLSEAEMSLAELLEPATEAELQGALAKVASAQETLDELLEGATEADIASAQATLAKAEETLETLTDGPSDEDIALADSKVAQAKLTLQKAQFALVSAQDDLEATDLTAPIDGTVLEVNTEVGERVTENATVITMADLGQPLIEVYVDESDVAMVQVGYEATIEFDALPDEVFTGHVISVDPQLHTVQNTYVVLAYVELDADSFAKPESLMPGMNATLDIVGGHAENALLVPVEALRDLGDGEYAVFVVVDGEPQMRMVEVGLMDYTYAEIISGVDAGEYVSTGIVETS